MTAKLATEDAQNQQLRQRLASLSRQLDELEGTRDALRRAGEELQELRDRVRRGEEANERVATATTAPPSGLLSEVEALRRRVVEMEGKDEELIRVGDQCRDLDRRLGRESSQCRSLKAEVDKLNGRISELDRIEEALGKSRQECSTLKSSLEKERGVTKQLSGEIDIMKVRVRELETVEAQLEKTEGALRQDLAKLRTLTMALVEDRKTVTERLHQAEQKLSRREGEPKEQNAPAVSMAVRMREERQQVLRSKADLEERLKSLAKENDELLARLKAEEERNGDLQSKVNILRKRAQVLESRRGKGETDEKEMDINDPLSNNSNDGCQEENNKIKELSQEVDMLRKRLQEKEVVEGDLIRVQEDFESLELSFGEELDRSKTLTEELEEAKNELSKYQLAEKQEVNQEHHLLRRLQQEQVKSRLLAREVDALKEKLHRLMGTEESISRVQVDHSTLHKKLSQQEARNRELAREMEELSGELERYRRFSKTLRPGVNGRRFSDLHQSTKEVQTEQTESLPPEYSNLSPIEFDGSDDEDPNHNEDPATRRRISTPVKDFKSLNHSNNARRYSGQSANGIDMQLTPNREVMNGNLVKKGDVVLTHTPGQPLQIKVTPDHGLNTATLEFSSPTTDGATSYTSTAVIPTSGASPKQRITIIQNSNNLSAVKTRSSPSSPERDLSPPLAVTPVSQVTSPDSSRSVTPDHTTPPVQIVTVSTCSPEPTDVAGQTVFTMSPERQNSWHVQRSSGTNISPSVFTTEDNKIHIHLGSPYIQGVSGIANGNPHPGSGSYYSLRQEQRTQILTNGCHVKGGGKITSSITITPTTSPVSQPSNITIPMAMESLQKPGPTRIPKPKGYSFNRGTSRAMNTGQNNNIQHSTMYTGKNTGLRMPNRPKAASTT